MTQLPSRWNGELELIVGATFRGLKPFGCSIRIGDTFQYPDQRWTTMIHELLHSVSSGYNRFDFENNVVWEEGVVEGWQRLLRPDLLSALGIDVEPTLLKLLDDNHPFNSYIEALENIREALSEDRRLFYLALIREPIKSRYGMLMARANALPGTERLIAIAAVAAAQVRLRQGARLR